MIPPTVVFLRRTLNRFRTYSYVPDFLERTSPLSLAWVGLDVELPSISVPLGSTRRQEVSYPSAYPLITLCHAIHALLFLFVVRFPPGRAPVYLHPPYPSRGEKKEVKSTQLKNSFPFVVALIALSSWTVLYAYHELFFLVI